MRLKKRYFGLVGIAILAYILWKLDIGKVIEILLTISPGVFAAAVALEALGVVLKGLKYKVVVKGHGKDISLLDATRFFLVGFFISLVTPGRVGEVSRAFYASSKIGSLGKSVSAFVLDRAIDIAILIALCFASAIFLSFGLGIEAVPVSMVVLAAVLFALGMVALSKPSLVRRILGPFFHRILPERHKGKAKLGFEEFYSSFRPALRDRKHLALSIAVGILAWAGVGLATYLYLVALGISVPLYFVFFLMPAINFAGNLPVSFSGLGTREATAIMLLSVYGVTAAEAVAFSALVFSVGYLLTALIGFALFAKESRKHS